MSIYRNHTESWHARHAQCMSYSTPFLDGLITYCIKLLLLHSLCLQHLSGEGVPFYAISLIDILKVLFSIPAIVKKMVMYSDQSDDVMRVYMH